MIVERFRKCSDLVREGKMFIKNKTKVASGGKDLRCNSLFIVCQRRWGSSEDEGSSWSYISANNNICL